MKVFHTHKVEIVDSPFDLGNEQQTEKTARVDMFDALGKLIESRDYGLVDREKVYQWIRAEEGVDLNNCYVADFSLTEYRSKQELTGNAHVSINRFSAIGAFFDSENLIDFSYAEFKGDYFNAVGACFVTPVLSFFHAHFEKGDKDFSRSRMLAKEVNFQYAEFNSGRKDFKEVQFKCETVSFINADFSDGSAMFTGSSFLQANVAFQFAKFGKGEISFEKTYFNGRKIDFSKVEFGAGRLDFRLSEFDNCDLSFDESEMSNGRLRFRRAKFGTGRISFELGLFGGCEISFERTVFASGELSMLGCNCDAITFNSAHLNNFVDLRVAECRSIDLSETVVRDLIDLSNEHGKMKVQEVNFSGMRNLGRIFLDWYDLGVKDLIFNQKSTSTKMKAEQFRMLKEEFRQLGQYNDEDKAYLEFKRLELNEWKSRSLRRNKVSALWIYPIYWTENLIFDQIGHYATNPVRVLVSMVISFAIMTCMHIALSLYTASGIVSSVGDPDKLPLVTKSIYHSAITFLTIGYGDYYPSGYIRWLSAIEGFVGLFLMSYFTVAFVRKVLR